MYIKCKNRVKDSSGGTAACVQVKLELGHKATIRSKPTAEGFTHDWTVFVRGPESYNIQHFVEKVVFNLHESFPKPKRVVKEPPYQVSESGYAGFVLPIDVHFKNKEEPKKIQFDYDLFLHVGGPPVNHVRCEKLTFQNPTEDFRRKLIKSGGVGILGPDGGTVLGQQGSGGPEESAAEVHSSQISKSKSSPDVVRKHKSTTASKEIKPVVSVSATATPVVSEPFVALFGQPIKTNKLSPDPKKTKDAGGRSSSSSKSSKSGSSSSGRDHVPSPSSDSREGKLSSHLKDGKPPIKENINKTGGKRPPLPPPSLPSNATTSDPKITNKENKGSSLKRPPSPLSPPPSDSNKEVKKRKSSSSSSTKKSKDKHQTEKKEKIKEKESKKKEGSQSSSHAKVPKEHDREKAVSESSSSSKVRSVEKESKSSSKKKTVDDTPSKPKFHKETSVDSTKGSVESAKGSKSSIAEQRHSNSSSLDASPDSSISFSSLQISGKRGPLGALMAELDDQDDDDELVSPLSSDPPSPPHFSAQETLPTKVEPMESSPKREKNEKPKVSKHKTSKSAPVDCENASRDKVTSSSDSNSSLQNLPVGACESDLNKLVALQHKLMLLTDRDHLQKVVDLIEETGQYSVSSSTFDFDLCALDKETVNKIYVCLVKSESVTS